MAKFNAVVIKAIDGTEIHFVTRGRSKEPTMDEILEYATEAGINISERSDEQDWDPPNPKMFLADLRSGLAFCTQKYGITQHTLENYIREKAPHINLSSWRKDG